MKIVDEFVESAHRLPVVEVWRLIGVLSGMEQLNLEMSSLARSLAIAWRTLTLWERANVLYQLEPDAAAAVRASARALSVVARKDDAARENATMLVAL